VKALEVAFDDEAADALAELTEAPAAYWQTRDQLAWT
jgi:hypothetical protein